MTVSGCTNRSRILHPLQERESHAQKAQPGPAGISGQNQELVTQGEILEKQISTRFENGCGQAQQKSQPAKHAAHHPTRSIGSRAFFGRMELLPTTAPSILAAENLLVRYTRFIARANDGRIP
jgi:hypothetical protein